MKRTKSGWIKRLGCGLLTIMMISASVDSSWASAVSRAEKEKKEAQAQLDAAKKKAQEAEDKKNAAAGQVTELNGILTTLLSDIQFLEIDMKNKEKEIEQAEIEYEAAKEKEAKQYASMKKRIQYMYERGDTQYLDVILQVKSMADLLNKAEYVEDIYNYDRKMLEAFKETKLAVVDLKNQLEDDRSEMKIMEAEYKSQKEQLESTISTKRKEISDFDGQLAKAKKDAEEYSKTITKKNQEIQKAKEEETRKREAERRKAEEAARKKAEEAAKRQSFNSTTNKPSSSIGPGGNKKPNSAASMKSSGGTEAGRAVADYGLQFVGNPYVYGGRSLTTGADCSGFTGSVYRNFGINLPRTSREQRSSGREVAYEDAQPGDLVCYSGHIGIYIGNGQIVHASSPSTGIKVSPATYRTILSVRRIL